MDNIDYSDKENVVAAALFYQHLSEKSEDFLSEHGFSKEKGLTQEEMATRLGVSTPAVNKWENDNTLPDILNRYKLSVQSSLTN